MKSCISLLFLSVCLFSSIQSQAEQPENHRSAAVSAIMERVDEYPFNPIEDGFTKEPTSDNHAGVADLEDQAWRVRLLAIRDLVRLGGDALPEIIQQLEHENPHVRHVAAYVLGLHSSPQSEKTLIELLKEEKDVVVRSQAVISLGQLQSREALPLLKEKAENDPSRDIRHQCKLAIHRINEYKETEKDRKQKFASLDESTFEQIQVGEPAIDFELQDTEGKTWRLSDFQGEKHVILIWIFADWCPVCHSEFRDLIQMKKEYEEQDVQVFTIECHDLYRCRVMVGKEYQPDYRFTKESPQKFYQENIWWPHLVDRAGALGAMYGVQPMEFVVHSEWINRPSTIIVDKEGIVRFAYYGTYWGDRPSIEETLKMIESDDYEFQHPNRLQSEK